MRCCKVEEGAPGKQVNSNMWHKDKSDVFTSQCQSGTGRCPGLDYEEKARMKS
jgi:hypothetical protein